MTFQNQFFPIYKNKKISNFKTYFIIKKYIWWRSLQIVNERENELME